MSTLSSPLVHLARDKPPETRVLLLTGLPSGQDKGDQLWPGPWASVGQLGGARRAHVVGGHVPPRSVGFTSNDVDPVGRGVSCWCLWASASFVAVSFWSRWKGEKEEEEHGAASAVC